MQLSTASSPFAGKCKRIALIRGFEGEDSIRNKEAKCKPSVDVQASRNGSIGVRIYIKSTTGGAAASLGFGDGNSFDAWEHGSERIIIMARRKDPEMWDRITGRYI